MSVVSCRHTSMDGATDVKPLELAQARLVNSDSHLAQASSEPPVGSWVVGRTKADQPTGQSRRNQVQSACPSHSGGRNVDLWDSPGVGSSSRMCDSLSRAGDTPRRALLRVSIPCGQERRGMDILELIETGDANVAIHDLSTPLRASAEAFLRTYDSYVGYSVVAASPHAERVLGAAMILRPEINAVADGRTLILDVNVASGTLMARAARRLRDRGNSSNLVGVALHALVGPGWDWDIDGLTDLVVIGYGPTDSRAGQAAQGGDCWVQLAG